MIISESGGDRWLIPLTSCQDKASARHEQTIIFARIFGSEYGHDQQGSQKDREGRASLQSSTRPRTRRRSVSLSGEIGVKQFVHPFLSPPTVDDPVLALSFARRGRCTFGWSR